MTVAIVVCAAPSAGAETGELRRMASRRPVDGHVVSVASPEPVVAT